MFVGTPRFTRQARGHLIFRRAVPKDLAQVFGNRREIRLSLRTSDRALAIERWLLHSARWQTLVRQLRLEIAMGKKPIIGGLPESLRDFLADDGRLSGWTLATDDKDPNKVTITAERSEYADVAQQLLAMSGESPAPSAVKGSSGRTLSKLIAEFLQELQLRSLDPQTKEGYAASLALFIEVLGDIPVQEITKERLFECKNVILALPPNRKKSPATRDLTLAQVLKHQEELRSSGGTPKVMSNRTFNGHWGRFSAMLRWGVENGRVDANRASGMEISEKASTEKKRYSFSPEDLKTIFESGFFAPGGYDYPSEYWVPVLAIFTGARVGELSQLLVTDVGEIDGITYIDINDDGDPKKKIKNMASRRRVPIHSSIGQPFAEFVEARRRTTEARLFPELSWSHKDGPGRKIGRYFNTVIRPKVGINERKKVFHSFRHTFMNRLDEVNAPEHLSKRIYGHAPKDEASRSYRDPTAAPMLATYVERLSYTFKLPVFVAPKPKRIARGRRPKAKRF